MCWINGWTLRGSFTSDQIGFICFSCAWLLIAEVLPYSMKTIRIYLVKYACVYLNFHHFNWKSPYQNILVRKRSCYAIAIIYTGLYRFFLCLFFPDQQTEPDFQRGRLRQTNSNSGLLNSQYNAIKSLPCGSVIVRTEAEVQHQENINDRLQDWPTLSS